MTGAVSGRDAELAALRSFTASFAQASTALVLEGAAGMGKTTLWNAGVQDAAAGGIRVLRAAPAESETSLSFSGLGDLLDPVLDEALAPLPAGQRSALSRALVLEEADGASPDAHAVGVAVLNAFRALAEAGPQLVAVDDVQWLDPASAAALAYAARRLTHEPVGLLLAKREGIESTVESELRRSFPPDRFVEIEVGPLDVGALHRIVLDQLGVALPRPLLTEVHQASGGNPFYALELVRMLQRSGISVEAGHRLPVPDSLHELVHGRVLALPPASRDYLLAAAALSHPTTKIVEAATGVSRRDGLTPAREARVVELEGDRIRFTHPLLASGAYETADPLRRAEMHARLAELVEDPEARGRHLAASVDEPDEAVAAALDEAAHHARARGGLRAAALLLDRARELTPDDRPEDALRRAVEAANLHFESGDSPRAELQLEDVIRRLPAGRQRASALVRLGRVRSFEAQAEGVDLYLQAVSEAEGDREILAVAHEGVAACLFRIRERLDDAVEHAELAAGLALAFGDEALASEALTSRLLPETLLGREAATETLDRALALQDAAKDRRVLGQPLCMACVHWWWTDALEQARDVLVEMLRRSQELGDEASFPYVLVLLGQVECVLGDFESALARALEGQEASEQSGQHTSFVYNVALESLALAYLGRVDAARVAASRALERVLATGGRPAELVAFAALGHLELALGAADEAAAQLEPATDFVRQQGISEPGATRFVIDHVEALVELGRRDEAAALLDWYEGNATRLDRASALAATARCRGLLASADGEVEVALAAYARALELHARVDVPLDRARTLLALGAAQRRAKRRREARQTLEAALASFEELGAAVWAERARAELRRISGRAATPGALTPAEERVASLVAEGKTNKEIAAALFLSERTVEGHLSKVYGKVGVRSRTELARTLPASANHEVAASNTGDSPVSPSSSAP